MAGAGFAINGQFINRADNWENRVCMCWGGRGSRILAFHTLIFDFLSNGLQHGILVGTVLKGNHLA